ncbi:nucleotidyltransferase domain-containing protein [Paenibacillus cremeus]|uniref:Nucleotidyltransferase domain-containing protein n=1 Tax=Paenibacillus cremeus TaxID=2163881 RepID=A0A559JPT8_9BACL|nr:nucleotidyltransferase domain-containing protein [Paenibacillus cremeus]TVY01906.1 nucleotidyltransferase domain-containing protein [Paenibacillus cremeus]
MEPGKKVKCVKETILEELRRIEQEEQVRVLYACEAGSRAYGLASEESDYDVRFLYVHPVEWYLSIWDKRDVIERRISDTLDISGWDLRKALSLFRKSNPPLLEWLQSPIPYYEAYSAAERVRQLSPLTFAPQSCTYHYLHMAERNYRDFLSTGEQIRTKKYFYVLRPIFSCMWIETRNEMPPLDFDRLVDELVPAHSELRAAIKRLVERKKAGDEFDTEPRVNVLNQFLEEQIAHFKQSAAQLPSAPPGQEARLDELFRETLREVWGRPV